MVKAMRWHYLRKNKSSELPAYVFYVDTETQVDSLEGNIEWQKFRLGVTCFARHIVSRDKWLYKWQRWKNPELLVEEISAKAKTYNTLYVLGSNPVFDCWVLDAYRILHSLGWRMKFFYDKALMHILKAKNGRSTIIFLAIQNFFPVSIAKIGEWLGLPRGKIDYKDSPEYEVWPYCEQDVLILMKAFEKWLTFVSEYDMGSFGLTRAAQAMKAFKHKFMKHRILVHGNEEVIEWERKAYMGGRTECFVLGKYTDGPFLTLDINSMYPYFMRNLELPIRLCNIARNCSVLWLERELRHFCCVARVRLTTNEPAFAVRRNNTLIFPVGSFDVWLTMPGLRYAFSKNMISQVYYCASYDKANIFKDFVDTFYELRRQFQKSGDLVFDQICKYLLNCFYGKWAQQAPNISGEKQTDNGQLERQYIIDLDTGERSIYTRLMGKEWLESGKTNCSQNVVAISAHITEAARIYLWQLINRLPRGGVLYCDTDSIIIRAKDLPTFTDVVSESELGLLGVESESSMVDIRGLKDYAKDGVNKIKGIRKDAEQLSPWQFRQKMFPGIYTLLADAPPGLFPVITRDKELKRIYKKATVDSLTGATLPFTF